AAPPQLQGCLAMGDVINCFTNLDDFAGFFLFIANPAGTSNIVCDTTNLVGCVTNVSGGVTNLTGCTTNCVTNLTVGAVLVAEIPPLVAAPGLLNFKGKSVLTPPLAPPNLNAK